MAFRVIIVEDNPLTIRSLTETIDWAALDCEVIGTARDGESGRKLILEQSPDLVLTDIRMPQMDGLDMIEAVRPSLPDTKFMIITGYDQFHYASRAIRLAVCDYLLKPIRNEEVVEAVNRAVEDLKRKQDAGASPEQMLQLRRKASLLSLLTNPAQRGLGIRGMIDDVELHFGAYYILTVQPVETEPLSQGVLNYLERLIGTRAASSVTCLLYDTMVAFVMRPQEDTSWRGEAEMLAEDVINDAPFRVRIGVSTQQTSIHKIRQAYQQSRQAMWEAGLTRAAQAGESAVSFFTDDMDRNLPSENVAAYNERISALMEKADLSDESAISAAKELIDLSGHQYSRLRALTVMYAMQLQSRFGTASDPRSDTAVYEAWFVTANEDVENVLLKICEALREGTRQQQYSLLVQNTLRYINLHAAENLQLNAMADVMCVSANYLSALIRKETGVTYHDHVLNAKMAVARTMLSDPRILIEEVARAVGYSNYISFYNAFKRTEHMTPTEYRNRRVQG